MTKLFNYLKSMFKKDYWVQPFPEKYAPECFDCNESTCVNCKFN